MSHEHVTQIYIVRALLSFCFHSITFVNKSITQTTVVQQYPWLNIGSIKYTQECLLRLFSRSLFSIRQVKLPIEYDVTLLMLPNNSITARALRAGTMVHGLLWRAILE